MLESVERAGLELLVSREAAELYGINVVFTNRIGGYSTGPYESLNLSFRVGDRRDSVISNRQRLGEALGVPLSNWVMAQQIHRAGVAVVGETERGRGAYDHRSALPRCDGLITGSPGTALGVLVADCIPLILAAPGRGAVAVVHAGWRGLLQRVTASAAGRLAGFAGCPSGEIVAFLGPHIRSCCFAVDRSVAGVFEQRFGGDVVHRERDGACRLDLEAACVLELERSGVCWSNIYPSGECTCCGETYFSYRASGGATGRQAGLVMLSR